MDDIDFSADELLQFAFPKLNRQYSGLPVNKYLALSKGNYPEAKNIAENNPFEKIISKTLKRYRPNVKSYKSVKNIWNQENDNLERATRLIACLEEDHIDITELEEILKSLFENDMNILNRSDKEFTQVKTNIRRLIRIFDYLKWGKKKERNNDNIY